MPQIKEFKKAFNILFTRYKAIDFKQMEEDKRNKARLYIQELKNTKEIGKWMDKTRELSKFLRESQDLNARFFSSQLKLVASGPETLRSVICDREKPSYFNRSYQEYLDTLLEKLDTEVITSPEHPQGDALRGFYLSSQFYYQLLKSPKKPSVTPTPSEVITAMKSTGKEASQNPMIKPFYDLFSKYANRPVIDNPELTFVTTYLYRVFSEAIRSDDRFNGIEERNEFIKLFGDEINKIGKAFEVDNIFKVYYSISKLFDYIENREDVSNS